MATTDGHKKRKAAVVNDVKPSKRPRTADAPSKTQNEAPKKSSLKKTTAEPIEADEIPFEPEVSDAEVDEDQVTALLKGFEDDSSASEAEDGSTALTNTFDTANLPDPSTAISKLKSSSALTNAAPTDSSDPTVLYISRIPHGFFEPQMRAYFSQFGDVKHLRMARNRRTGASKHYAFLEYESAEVAGIVQRTMDNYLMFKHVLKVRLVPREKVHADLWKGADSRFRKVPWNRIERTRLASTDREGWGKRLEREEKSRAIKAEKMRALGYVYQAPKLREVDSVPVQAVEAKAPVKAIEAPKEVVEAEAPKTTTTVTATVPIKELKAAKKAKREDQVKAAKGSKRIATA